MHVRLYLNFVTKLNNQGKIAPGNEWQFVFCLLKFKVKHIFTYCQINVYDHKC
jgi:hypothetical protein